MEKDPHYTSYLTLLCAVSEQCHGIWIQWYLLPSTLSDIGKVLHTLDCRPFSSLSSFLASGGVPALTGLSNPASPRTVSM